MAITSGFTRPSSVGPQLVKLEILTSDPFVGIREEIDAAPTVKMFLDVPEVEMISYPSFFALALLDESLVERKK
jgi:hypothetical protein